MRWALAAALVGAWGLLGCSGDEDAEQHRATSVVLFGPAAETELTPYPSNRYTVEDASTATGLRVQLTTHTTTDQLVTEFPDTAKQLSEMDGFSTTGGVVVKFSAPIDARGIDRVLDADPPVLDAVDDASVYTEPDAPFMLVNVDPNSAEQGQAVGLVPRYFQQAQDEFFLFDEYTLIAQPAMPLRPKTRYVFVVTRELLAYDGTPVGSTAAMRSALASSKDDYSAELRDAVASAAGSVGFDAGAVVGATVFTTASVQDDVIALSNARRAEPPPTTVEDWSIETPLSAPDTRARFVASYSAPEFRRPKPDGKWGLDESGVPVVQKSAQLEAFLAFSDATQSGPRPVVIFAHGLGGDKDGCWGTSERLAGIDPRGAAVFAIDSPEHGSRALGSTSLITSVYGFFGIDEGTQDFDIGRARDNFRQMAFDQLELVRWIRSLGSLDLLPLDAQGNPAPDGVPDLDVSRILYIGHSFGAVQGATIAALAPEIELATWNVGGAGLMMVLRDSDLFSLVVSSLTPPGTPYGAVARFMAEAQAIVDPGDPLNYARNATLERLAGVPGWTGTNVLLQEVVLDTIVPNSSSEALARGAGLSLLNDVTSPSGLSAVGAPVSGNLSTGSTGVICQFDKMNGNETAAHGELIFAEEARAQYVEFFKSGLSGTASVPAPY